VLGAFPQRPENADFVEQAVDSIGEFPAQFMIVL
jgi:hypothetical protein